MPRTEYNAPGFRYRVYWKLDATDQNWSSEEITDPTKNEFVVCNRSTYQRHRVKVIASNDLGDCRAPQKEIIGYSGEDGNFEINFFFFFFTILIFYNRLHSQSL